MSKKVTRKPARTVAPKKITAEDIVDAVKGMTAEDKAVFVSMLGSVPDPTGASTRRTVSEKAPNIDDPVKMEIAAPPQKVEPVPGVIFKSPHLGFWQLLKKSWKERLTDDDYEIHAPKFAEFVNGTWRAETDEEIDLMRAKIEKKRRRGGQVQVMEVKDERIKEKLDTGRTVDTVKSDTVTVDTPLEELVT